MYWTRDGWKMAEPPPVQVGHARGGNRLRTALLIVAAFSAALIGWYRWEDMVADREALQGPRGRPSAGDQSTTADSKRTVGIADVVPSPSASRLSIGSARAPVDDDNGSERPTAGSSGLIDARAAAGAVATEAQGRELTTPDGTATTQSAPAFVRVYFRAREFATYAMVRIDDKVVPGMKTTTLRENWVLISGPLAPGEHELKVWMNPTKPGRGSSEVASLRVELKPGTTTTFQATYSPVERRLLLYVSP